MLEITSNLRFSLDLFELATFDTNNDLQTADEAITGCTKVVVRYFGSFPAKRSVEMIATLVFFSKNFTLQNAPGAKGQRIVIWRFWRPLCAKNEARNLLFKLFSVDAC